MARVLITCEPMTSWAGFVSTGLSGLVLVALAPASAAADDKPHGGLITAGLGLGIVRLDSGPSSFLETGLAAGLVVSASAVGRRGVGGVVEAAAWRTGSWGCAADAICYRDRAARMATTTIGVRWQVGPALYLQGSGGVALSWYQNDESNQRGHWWSPAGVAAVGWRRTIPDAVLGFELRASALRNDTTTVTTVAAVLSIGHTW